MSKKVSFGHVTPWWPEDFKTLDYEYYPLKNSPEDIQRWKNQGYDKININGGLYNMSKPMPDYADGFFNLFPLKNVGIGFYCMKTCDFLPVHRDHYITYRDKFEIIDPADIWRAVVFLEDWKSGHYFEIGDRPIVNWKAGNWVLWNYDIPHSAGNFGIENRYTVQITGCTI